MTKQVMRGQEYVLQHQFLLRQSAAVLGSFGPQWMNKGFEVASSRKQTTRTTASDLLAFVWESERPHL